MKKKLLLIALFAIWLFQAPTLLAQDDFDMGDFMMADDTEVKQFCNNKMTNLSPTKLVSIGYDVTGGFDLESTYPGSDVTSTAPVSANHGLRLDANFPVISTSAIIINASVRYWESRYNVGQSELGLVESNDILGGIINERPLFTDHLDAFPLRTTTAGVVVFKPLNNKNFIIGQFEAALNGNYNFDEFDPDFGKMKYSASLLYGWKFDDNTNLAFGATRTYRGGRLLHIPILLYNKTFNETWGMELLLPARGHVRRNFSTKSILMLGYELEGQSYHIQNTSDAPSQADWELRKSEIRPRISWDKSLTDFIWFSAEAGVRINYRFDVDPSADASDAIIENNIGMPLYFRVGLNLVSP